MPTPDPARAFDPARADLRLECGTFETAGGGLVQLNLHVNGERGGYYSLAVREPRGKEVIVFLGRVEWNAMIDAVDEGRKLFARLMGAGNIEEFAPVVPG